jgi:hypothetical protein
MGTTICCMYLLFFLPFLTLNLNVLLKGGGYVLLDIKCVYVLVYKLGCY